MRLFSEAKFGFMGQRKLAYIISIGTIVALIAAALFFQVSRGSWLNYGVDFLGGTLVQVQVDAETNVADIRSVANSVVSGAEVTRFGEETEFLIRAPQQGDVEGVETADAIVAAIGAEYGAEQVTVDRIEVVGPKIGAELQTRAMLALAFSFLATLIYLAFRFEWRFGVAALIATLHDIVWTLGLISLFRIEVSVTTVAAVLTIVGYSLNDTIVVFDRIRENLTKLARRETYRNIIDLSINETLPRTIMTSMTTLAALLSLFLLGGEIIRDFAMILIIGILLGTYSSIFVAAPILYEIERRSDDDQPVRRPSKAKGARTAAL